MGVDLQLNVVNSQRLENGVRYGDDLRVRCRRGRAEDLHAELVKFPQPAGLRLS